MMRGHAPSSGPRGPSSVLVPRPGLRRCWLSVACNVRGAESERSDAIRDDAFMQRDGCGIVFSASRHGRFFEGYLGLGGANAPSADTRGFTTSSSRGHGADTSASPVRATRAGPVPDAPDTSDGRRTATPTQAAACARCRPCASRSLASDRGPPPRAVSLCCVHRSRPGTRHQRDSPCVPHTWIGILASPRNLRAAPGTIGFADAPPSASCGTIAGEVGTSDLRQDDDTSTCSSTLEDTHHAAPGRASPPAPPVARFPRPSRERATADPNLEARAEHAGPVLSDPWPHVRALRDAQAGARTPAGVEPRLGDGRPDARG